MPPHGDSLPQSEADRKSEPRYEGGIFLKISLEPLDSAMPEHSTLKFCSVI